MFMSRKHLPVCLGVLTLSGCGGDGISFLAPGGMIADAQRHWLLVIIGLVLIVVVPVFVALPLCLWRYRYGGQGAYRPKWEFSWTLEILSWGVPSVIVLALALLIAGPETRLSPYHPVGAGAPLRVQVVALNWKWLFVYPDQHIASVDTLAVPVGRSVRFSLTSDKTMQSFDIPALGSQIYAMAGMATVLNLVADRPGEFMGQNTQFNGMGFQDEKFRVLAMSDADFGKWVGGVQGSGHALDGAAYGALLKDQSGRDAAREMGVSVFSDVPDGFFDKIVEKYHPMQTLSAQ